MKVTRKELAEYIAKRTLRVKDYKTLVHEVAAYLLHERRTSDLASLIRDIMKYRAELGIIEAAAVSAHTLSTDVTKEIRQILKQQFPDAKEVSVTNKIDENVVGGVKIELPGKQLDLTLRGRLATFKRLTDEIKE